MYAWEAIEKTLNYIENHLSEEIKTETLAEIACLSPFYYQRLFKKLVRKPVQEYIKLRRLAKALHKLKNPTHRILDVALDYGFSSHANFTRAFKEVYQITPELYKKELLLLNTFDKPALSINYVLIDENVPLIAGTTVLEIRKETLVEPEFYLGFEGEVHFASQIPVGESTGVDIPGQIWQDFHSKKNILSDYIYNDVELGMSHSANHEKGSFTYFAGGLAKSNNISISNDIVQRFIPAGEYVVCKIEAESFEELVTNALNQANKYLFETWLPKNKLITQPFSAEKYNVEKKEVYSMEIWVLPQNASNQEQVSP